jgi:anti-sigma factor ChrR (cupin superfamily)
MSSKRECEFTERLCEYALRASPASEAAEVEAHLERCSECREHLAALRPVVDSFAFWPRDVLQPSAGVWDRLAKRIAAETGTSPMPKPERRWEEPRWKQVAPGIEVKLLAADEQNERVSMLVRLAPGGAYPPHRHAGVEELHLLYGELMIEDRKLYPGDYNRGEPGTGDKLVWSETGCTCVLVTSTRDALG